MNILRRRRKSKKKLKLKTFILFIFSLVMTTFAWFAYSKILDPTLNIHVASWNMKYYIGTGENRQQLTNPLGIEIPILYPAMDEQTVTVYIENNGDTLVDIEHQVKSLTIAGISFEIVQEGRNPTTENYIIVTPSVYQGEIVKGAITYDITKLPFTIEIEHSAQVAAGKEGYLNVTVNWIGDNNDLDSKWGYIVSDYLMNNENATTMSMQIGIDSYQADTEGESIITQTMPSTSETTPYLPTGFSRVPGTSFESGLVIEDSSGNQYVWIEVPKNETVYANSKLSITEFTTDEYTSIENDLKAYSADYRTRDEVYSSYTAIGLPESDQDGIAYNELKQKMLKSIYQNGGFYIGRYETGISDSYRTKSTSTTPSETPVIQANAYPFNWITCSQANTLAINMESGDHTSSLMFGLQWDLVMKYLETKGVEPSDLNTDSTTWGNYISNTYYVTNSKAKYILTNEYLDAPYEKATNASALLSTGAYSLFSKQNIYDLAGNLTEWTYNVMYSEGTPYGGNGGDYSSTGNNPANYCGIYNPTKGFKYVGFRVTIY